MKYPSLRSHEPCNLKFCDSKGWALEKEKLADPEYQPIVKFEFKRRVQSWPWPAGIYAPYIPMIKTPTIGKSAWDKSFTNKQWYTTGKLLTLLSPTKNNRVYSISSTSSAKLTVGLKPFYVVNLESYKLYKHDGIKIRQIKIKKRQLMPLIRYLESKI